MRSAAGIKKFLKERLVDLNRVVFDDEELVLVTDDGALVLNQRFRHSDEWILKKLAQYLHDLIDKEEAEEIFETFVEHGEVLQMTRTDMEKHRGYVETDFRERFVDACLNLGRELQGVIFTRNNSRFLSGGLKGTRVHEIFLECPDNIVAALALRLVRGSTSALRTTKEFFHEHFDTWKRVKDLGGMWLGSITAYKVGTRAPKKKNLKGTITEEDLAVDCDEEDCECVLGSEDCEDCPDNLNAKPKAVPKKKAPRKKKARPRKKAPNRWPTPKTKSKGWKGIRDKDAALWPDDIIEAIENKKKRRK
jgi:hypothetical protein